MPTGSLDGYRTYLRTYGVTGLKDELNRVAMLSQRSRSVHDLNGDGKADIVWRHIVSGHVAVWLLDGETVRAGAVVAQAGDLNWQFQQNLTAR
jgi:hypothetical protein